METKTFTVVDTETQTYKNIQSTATTLAELKTDLINAGFNLENKAIQEAYTKTELLNDDSLLPTNVQIRRGPNAGTTTNNLVFRLTKNNKNIKSGSDRNALYAAVREGNYQEEIRNKYNTPYTNLSNEVLERFIDEHSAACNCTDCVIAEILGKLVDDLYMEDVIVTEDLAWYKSKIAQISHNAGKEDVPNKAEIDALLAELD
jgi:hypothetical protein